GLLQPRRQRRLFRSAGGRAAVYQRQGAVERARRRQLLARPSAEQHRVSRRLRLLLAVRRQAAVLAAAFHVVAGDRVQHAGIVESGPRTNRREQRLHLIQVLAGLGEDAVEREHLSAQRQRPQGGEEVAGLPQ